MVYGSIYTSVWHEINSWDVKNFLQAFLNKWFDGLKPCSRGKPIDTTPGEGDEDFLFSKTQNQFICE